MRTFAANIQSRSNAFIGKLGYPILIPILVLAVMGLSMGLFVPTLGFYLDDWPKIFFQQVKGAASTHLFQAHDGRPLQGWYQILFFSLFGTKAWAWQVYALALRYLTVLFSWLTFRKIWPKRELQLGLVAILFAVYPIFAQQPMAVSFMVHWTSFLCVVLSTYLMVLSIEHPRLYILLTLAAVVLSGVGLTLIEYFIGLEFIRPLLLWFLFAKYSPKERLSKVFLHFLPYLLTTGAFVVWRTSFIQLPVPDRNSLSLLSSLAAEPLRTLSGVVQTAAQDLVTMVFAGWYKTLQPELFNMGGPIDLMAIAMTLFIAALLILAFGSAATRSKAKERASSQDWRQMLLTGLAIIVLGALPGWLVGRQVSEFSGLWADRFGMASMPGAALVVVVLIWKVAAQNKTRIALFAVLVGLACGWQIRNANDYRWSWEDQQRILSQFVWRMPHIQTDTLILSLNEYFSKMGHYPTSFAINTLYPQTRDTEQVDYWYTPMSRFFDNEWDDYLAGKDLELGHWQAFFKGNSNDVIVVNYNEELLSCLWVLGPQDALHPLIDEYTRQWLAKSDLSRISRSPAAGFPRWDTIPKQPETWCYYFERADLAAQFGDWEEVVRLWRQADPYLGQVNAYTELAPFIKGLIHTGNVSEASELTLLAYSKTPSSEPYLCKIWKDAISEAELTVEDMLVADSIVESLSCRQLNPPQW